MTIFKKGILIITPTEKIPQTLKIIPCKKHNDFTLVTLFRQLQT